MLLCDPVIQKYLCIPNKNMRVLYEESRLHATLKILLLKSFSNSTIWK